MEFNPLKIGHLSEYSSNCWSLPVCRYFVDDEKIRGKCL